jgi:beta-glucosidase
MQKRWLAPVLAVLFGVTGAVTLFAGGPAQEGAFPEGFRWGTTISAHSTEGSTVNDWTAWETLPGRISDGSTSGAACNHRELFAEDHQWLKKLHLNCLLFSVEWSRIEPSRGTFDPAAIAQYRKVLENLKKLGIRPIVVLWDHTLPSWIAADGGFENPQIILDFAQYAAQVAKNFGDLADEYVTLNDPIGYANRAFKDGVCPPGKHDLTALAKAQLMMMGMHRVAYLELRANDVTPMVEATPACQVGLVMGFKLVRPSRPQNMLDASLARTVEGFSGKTFLESLMRGELQMPATPAAPAAGLGKGKGMPQPAPVPPAPPAPPSYDRRLVDFLIVEFKGLEEVKFNVLMPLFMEKVVPAGAAFDDAGQVIFPDGFTSVLAGLKKYPVPQYGMVSIDDAAGTRREAFIRDHVRQLRAALVQGCLVKGFFYRSLLNGFEYEKGFAPKRGLLQVNRRVQERKRSRGTAMLEALAVSNGMNEKPVRRGRSKKTPAAPPTTASKPPSSATPPVEPPAPPAAPVE